jgi:tRNA(Leu) C34 or U34 (ribose-2'-O)-methylase TrmL
LFVKLVLDCCEPTCLTSTHNSSQSAILRTAEALGVQYVYIISPQFINSTLVDDDENTVEQADEKNICLDKVKENTKLKTSTGQTVKRATESEKLDRAQHHLFAKKATEWLTVREFDDTKSCIDALREEGREIWATDLAQVAVCLTEDGIRQHLKSIERDSYHGKLIPEKVAIVMGTEAVGCSAEMLNAADLRVYLPLRGFADSLNLSVATALVVHQMFILDSSLVGAMSEEERKDLRRDWFARLASQRLLSSRQKKNRAKLIGYIRQCEEIEKKINTGERVEQDEIAKWKNLTTKKAELDAIDTKVKLDSQRAVKDLIDNPPDPITDMRRADEHRVCYVGKGTKNKYGELWGDMPATENAQSKEMASASFFRHRVRNGTCDDK